MNSVAVTDILLRVGAAFAAGVLVGWERESRGRPAGLRTTILTCVASAAAMIVSQELFLWGGTSTWKPDPARLGAGILTGIGFLGAGTIMRHENFVRGITTAATLWFVTVLGLAFGSGQFGLGYICLGVVLLTLMVLPRLEKHIETDWYAYLTVTTGAASPGEADLQKQLEALGVAVLAIKLAYDVPNRLKTVEFELRLKRSKRLALASRLLEEMARLPGVTQVRWH